VYPEVGAGVTGTGYDTRWAGPAGAAWSTAADVTAFLAALFHRSLLPAGALAAMTAAVPVAVPPTDTTWRDPGYGLGLMADRGRGVFGHGGGGPGYRSAAFIAPHRHRSVAVLARDSAGIDPTDLALDLLDG
jgi:D-alanyl-D-alanine carboxypeptidase